jgi:hypothetical protein
MKLALRQAFSDLPEVVLDGKKLIARETMGLKELFLRKMGTSPFVYRKRFFSEIFEDADQIMGLKKKLSALDKRRLVEVIK